MSICFQRSETRNETGARELKHTGTSKRVMLKKKGGTLSEKQADNDGDGAR
jgi:hypothetical protein